MKSSENLWKSWKSMKIDEIAASWDRAKVSIGAGPRQQTSPSVSKPRTLEIHKISWNLLKTYENQWKLMKIDEIAASWDRAKVSIGAGRSIPGERSLSFIPLKSMESHEILWKALKLMKIHRNSWNSRQLGSSKGFYRGRTSAANVAIRLQTSDPWNP